MEELQKPELKKSRAIEAIRRAAIKKFLILGVFIAVVLAFSAWGVIVYQNRLKNLPGRFFANQGQEHIAVNAPHPEYNSNPPTSGWHYGQPAEWGVYTKELPDEQLIHNLEHGGIWIAYKPDLSEEIKKKLEEFYKKYGRKIIVTPRAKNDSDIALAAWNHLDTFGVAEYSDERVEKFIKAFRNKGPEFVP